MDTAAENAEGADTDVATDEREGRGLESLDGLGETYANRLRNAGIGSLEQLARTSSETVADAAQTSEKRVTEWTTSAQSQA